MFLQFQAQIADLANEANPELTVATAEFERLPPVGIVPIAGGTRAGFDVPTFFAGLTTRGPEFIEGARLEALLRDAFAYAPISLTRGQAIWLYEVHENRDPKTWATTVGGPYVVFASGFVPYRANAQFDLSHWDFADYALVAC